MKALEQLRGKRIGLYIREEESGENLSTGYGRLQWLEHELEEHEGGLEIYADRKDSVSNLYELFDDIEDEFIEVILLWSVRDVEPSCVSMLAFLCEEKDIPIISFCETDESLNGTIRNIIGHIRIHNTSLGYF